MKKSYNKGSPQFYLDKSNVLIMQILSVLDKASDKAPSSAHAQCDIGLHHVTAELFHGHAAEDHIRVNRGRVSVAQQKHVASEYETAFCI